MSLKSGQQGSAKCLIVRRVDICPHCGWTRVEKGSLIGLPGNVILRDALWQKQSARATSRTPQIVMAFFSPSSLADGSILWFSFRASFTVFSYVTSLQMTHQNSDLLLRALGRSPQF